MRLIDADELNKFPIRLDHYDKEHGNEDFFCAHGERRTDANEPDGT